MKNKNKLIVFEGIDGVGKTAIVQEVKKLLQKRKTSVVLYEAYEKRYSNFSKLKPFIKNIPITGSLLFYLSSSVYKSYIISRLLKKHWVVCDRYVYSTMAYHKAKGSCLRIDLNSLGIIKPDYTFLLTINEKIRAERLKQKIILTKADRVPKIPGSIPHKMEKLFKKMNLIEIDNSGSLNETLNKISPFLFA